MIEPVLVFPNLFFFEGSPKNNTRTKILVIKREIKGSDLKYMPSLEEKLIVENEKLAERLSLVRNALDSCAEESPVAESALAALHHLLLSEKHVGTQKKPSSTRGEVNEESTGELKSRFFKFVDERRRDYKEEFNVLRLKLLATECAETELQWAKGEVERARAETKSVRKERDRYATEVEELLKGLDTKNGPPPDQEFDSLFGSQQVPQPAGEVGLVIAKYRTNLEEAIKKQKMLEKDNEALVLKMQSLSDEFYAQRMSMDDLAEENMRLKRRVVGGQTPSSGVIDALKEELAREKANNIDLMQRMQRMQQDTQALRDSKKDLERQVRMLEVELETSKDSDSAISSLRPESLDDADALKRKLSKLLVEKQETQIKVDEALEEIQNLQQCKEVHLVELRNATLKVQFLEQSLQRMRDATCHLEQTNENLKAEINSLREVRETPSSEQVVGTELNDLNTFTQYVTYRLWAERALRKKRQARSSDAGTQADIGPNAGNAPEMLLAKLQLINKELNKDQELLASRLKTSESELATYKGLFLKARSTAHNVEDQTAQGATSIPKTMPDEEGEGKHMWMLEQQRNDAVTALEVMQRHNEILQDEVDRQGIVMQQLLASRGHGVGGSPLSQPTTPSSGGLRSLFGSRSRSLEQEVLALNARVRSLQGLLENQLKENIALSSQLESMNHK